MYSVVLRIDELPSMQADVMQQWARAAYRKAWHKKIALAVMMAGGPPKEPLLYVSIYGVRHSSALPDRINCWNGFKAPVDGLIAKHAGVIKDDNPRVVLEEGYSWVKAPPKHGFITLAIQELLPPSGAQPPLL
jgi:hypothetical protein